MTNITQEDLRFLREEVNNYPKFTFDGEKVVAGGVTITNFQINETENNDWFMVDGRLFWFKIGGKFMWLAKHCFTTKKSIRVVAVPINKTHGRITQLQAN